MKGCGVHASVMASYETTESFSVTIASPIEIGVLVTHCRASYGDQALDNRTISVFGYDLSPTPICLE
jgi:hypothetical protein